MAESQDPNERNVYDRVASGGADTIAKCYAFLLKYGMNPATNRPDIRDQLIQVVATNPSSVGEFSQLHPDRDFILENNPCPTIPGPPPAVTGVLNDTGSAYRGCSGCQHRDLGTPTMPALGAGIAPASGTITVPPGTAGTNISFEHVVLYSILGVAGLTTLIVVTHLALKNK